jgi:hypothetical protein
VLDVMEALAELLAEDTGLVIDPAFERPFDWTADTLYVWEESSSWTPIGPSEVREDFVIMAAVAEATGEEAIATRNPETTAALYAHRETFLDRIRLSPNVGPWQDGNIQGDSVPAYLRQLDLRGIAVRVRGYRLIGGE